MRITLLIILTACLMLSTAWAEDEKTANTIEETAKDKDESTYSGKARKRKWEKHKKKS